jgi:hypothetical protein
MTCGSRTSASACAGAQQAAFGPQANWAAALVLRAAVQGWAAS